MPIEVSCPIRRGHACTVEWLKKEGENESRKRSRKRETDKRRASKLARLMMASSRRFTLPPERSRGGEHLLALMTVSMTVRQRKRSTCLASRRSATTAQLGASEEQTARPSPVNAPTNGSVLKPSIATPTPTSRHAPLGQTNGMQRHFSVDRSWWTRGRITKDDIEGDATSFRAESEAAPAPRLRGVAPTVTRCRRATRTDTTDTPSTGRGVLNG